MLSSANGKTQITEKKKQFSPRKIKYLLLTEFVKIGFMFVRQGEMDRGV